MPGAPSRSSYRASVELLVSGTDAKLIGPLELRAKIAEVIISIGLVRARRNIAGCRQSLTIGVDVFGK
jgi:hypothetical protein